MEKEKREQLGVTISGLVLKAINELEKEMAEKCIDYGQLTRKEKERFIDEILFFLLFRVDVMLFTSFEQLERMAVKEKILENVFAPLYQEYAENEIVAVMKQSIERFTEYAQVLKKGGSHLDVYPLLRRRLQEINPLILEGTEGSKSGLYACFVQKNVEAALTRELRGVLENRN